MQQLTRHEREKIQIEQTITQCAEDLFLEYGYEQASMEMLSKRCEYTKRTIYRYFVCKEDLYFAVLLKGNIRMKSSLFDDEYDATDPKSLHRFIFKYRDFYFQNESFFDLMSQISNVRQKRDVATLPYYVKYEQFAALFHQEVIEFHQQVIGKGNINPTTRKNALIFIFIVQGLFGMLTQTDRRFTDFFGLDRKEFTTDALLFILDTVE